ncbi:LOW QUALITY PROTEIN: uncharacterized protein C3orf38 homolog [Atheta coriaria]|uniref:LOW QUALITY PROTEIN: uncharacterized protein C3orf38 homolog n=1 Tax=Dalotia coriaria TaxID=877792 RepID=UPI0031F3C85C
MIDNPGAINGIKQLLVNFSDSEVLSLCATITQGLLKNKINSRDAAIDAILKYSTDVASFLRRKVLTRNILFEYLHDSGIKVELPVTKDELIEIIVQAWDKNQINPNNPNRTEQNLDLYKKHLQIHIYTIMLKIYRNQKFLHQQQQIYILQMYTLIKHRTQLALTLEVMSLKFCEWFYELMNKNEVIGSEHFFPDASLQLKLVSDAISQEEEVKNDGKCIGNLLFKIKSEHGLFFNPNLHTDGTKGKTDPHGLVMIMSCGTLHINNIISGVFEQIFALARDPTSENNWKIKNTTLVLKSKSGVTSMPKLEHNLHSE